MLQGLRFGLCASGYKVRSETLSPKPQLIDIARVYARLACHGALQSGSGIDRRKNNLGDSAASSDCCSRGGSARTGRCLSSEAINHIMRYKPLQLAGVQRVGAPPPCPHCPQAPLSDKSSGGGRAKLHQRILKAASAMSWLQAAQAVSSCSSAGIHKSGSTDCKLKGCLLSGHANPLRGEGPFGSPCFPRLCFQGSTGTGTVGPGPPQLLLGRGKASLPSSFT